MARSATAETNNQTETDVETTESTYETENQNETKTASTVDETTRYNVERAKRSLAREITVSETRIADPDAVTLAWAQRTVNRPDFVAHLLERDTFFVPTDASDAPFVTGEQSAIDSIEALKFYLSPRYVAPSTDGTRSGASGWECGIVPQIRKSLTDTGREAKKAGHAVCGQHAETALDRLTAHLEATDDADFRVYCDAGCHYFKFEPKRAQLRIRYRLTDTGKRTGNRNASKVRSERIAEYHRVKSDLDDLFDA